MKILLLGSGGREHALAWKIAQSPKVEKLYIAPGNAGTTAVGENVNIKATDFEAISAFALKEDIAMVVVGPEDPLVKGIYDYFQNRPELKHIAVIGPSAQGAQLEGSKEFAKGFMMRHNIPTARYKSITSKNLEEGLAFLETLEAPYVLKADGLCAGKGVLILPTLDEAKKELNEMLNAKNRIAEIEQEFLQLNPEQHYFEEYYASYSDVPTESLDKLSSQKLLALWMEFEQHAEHETRLGLLQKLSIMFRFNRNALKLFLHSPELVIPYLQSQFYSVKRRELEVEKQELNRKLEHYAFDAKMDELTQKSLRLFRAELATRYHWRNNRRCFEKNDFRRNSEEFTREYPVVLSTTYSIKGTLSIDHIYDYLIVDEASQVDLATGVLAFSCARNIVIVGDLK